MPSSADALRERVWRAICDPGAFTPRGDDYQEPITRWQQRAVLDALGLEGVTRRREAALSALWRIRMAAETWGPDETPTAFANRIVFIAEGGMGGDRQEAQRLAAADARLRSVSDVVQEASDV
jgi:hypothetical protein